MSDSKLDKLLLNRTVNSSEGPDALCSGLFEEDHVISGDLCFFWVQGVLLGVVGVMGVVGNAISMRAYSRPERLSVFNHLLVAMTSFDTVYLVTSVAEFSLVETFHLTSRLYDLLFVYLLYPLHNVALCSSVLCHVALAFERYLAVCHPGRVYSNVRQSRRGRRRKEAGGMGGRLAAAGHTSQAREAVRKKVLVYVLPVALFSLLVNVPRWFELQLHRFETQEDGSQGQQNMTVYSFGIAGTSLRYDPAYVTYYLHWTILMVTGILPLSSLAFMNCRIYRAIREVRKIRNGRSGSRSRRPRSRMDSSYGATLASTIVVFAVCHLPRVVKTILEILVTDRLTGQTCSGINPARCLASFSNLILTLNASSSFLIYCFVGSFVQKVVVTLTNCCFCSCRRGSISSGGG